MRLSAVIITRNEARHIRECLESVSFADEIVVLDSGSTDETVKICREYGARVELTDWPGFGPQKNRAIDLAQAEWVLSIDADELVTPALREEMIQAMAHPGEYVAFHMPRASSYCGRIMRHGGWWPDHVIRLFRRGRGRFSDKRVHETLVVDGLVGELTQPLRHRSFVNLEEVLEKVNTYSSAGALQMLENGKRGGLFKAVGHGLWSFVRTYFFRLGCLDGAEGLMLAISNAEGTYYRYVKRGLLDREAADANQCHRDDLQ
ncbi:MAG: glycosyltransferase family 2 protein [Proteobacteria bacterium]|nr:glycosyltransferase family 2 protein [Pseudomonadota bacterium]MDE3207892.1 glycosyltransferase family 2 protein [Pseudomonadota bacterium]